MPLSASRFPARRIIVGIALTSCVQIALASAADEVLVKRPPFERAAGTQFELDAVVADYLRAVTRKWLLIAPDANPGMLEMFRDRDRQPLRAMEPWAGEFAGKYLTGAVQVYRVTHDEALREYLSTFVRELCSLQADDGYLGPWPNTSRLTGTAPNVGKGTDGPTWDAWGHYHIMVGLLAWSAETGDQQALQTAARIGDMFCQRFLGNQKPRLVDTGSTEMNLAQCIRCVCFIEQLVNRVTWSWRNRLRTNLRHAITPAIRWPAITSIPRRTQRSSFKRPSRDGRACIRSLVWPSCITLRVMIVIDRHSSTGGGAS